MTENHPNPPPDSQRFSQALKSAILWPVGVILLTAFLLLLMTFMLLKLVRQSDDSYEVLNQTRMCQTLVLDLESGSRGYLLRGNAIFLDPYNAALSQIDGAFDHLKDMVAANKDQTTRVNELIQAKNLWLDYAKSSVAQRAKGTTPNDDWARMGKQLMDNLSTRFDRVISTEEQQRIARLKDVHRMKLTLGFAGTGVVILLSLIVGQLVRRQFISLAQDYRSAIKAVEQRHTALQRSEADLEEQKEWFRVTLSSIGDGVIVTDKEGRVVFMNEEGERLTGWNSVEALLKPLNSIFRVIDQETRTRRDDPVAQVLRENRTTTLLYDTILLSRSGQEWPIEDSAAPIHDSKGKMLGVVLVFHDATTMRQAKTALQAHSADLEQMVSERTTTLQQAIAELEAFSYTVSHDLRSPLRAMQGFSQAVLEDYGDKLDDRGRDYLERVRNAAQRLDRLVQDLLSYTRMSRGQTVVQPLNLDKLTRDIIENYPNLRPPNAEVEFIGTLPRVMGQEAALTQVISNLLGNAAKFVVPGKIPHMRLWSEDFGSRTRIFIQDNGIGIAPENFERIFQMFVQINESQLYGGTGVGLAIVKKAAQVMGGSVGVESDGESGTKFWVELGKATDER